MHATKYPDGGTVLSSRPISVNTWRWRISEDRPGMMTEVQSVHLVLGKGWIRNWAGRIVEDPSDDGGLSYHAAAVQVVEWSWVMHVYPGGTGSVMPVMLVMFVVSMVDRNVDVVLLVFVVPEDLSEESSC